MCSNHHQERQPVKLCFCATLLQRWIDRLPIVRELAAKRVESGLKNGAHVAHDLVEALGKLAIAVCLIMLKSSCVSLSS